MKEELEELQTEIETGSANKDKIEEEFGDLMFALINYARYQDIDPELALEKTNKKFIRRFQFIENSVNNSLELERMSLEEMDHLWDKAKVEEKNFT